VEGRGGGGKRGMTEGCPRKELVSNGGSRGTGWKHVQGEFPPARKEGGKDRTSARLMLIGGAK